MAQNNVPGGVTINLLAVSGGSVTSNVTLPNQINWMQPVLLAQDGTFYGIVDYDWDQNNDDFLASFDQSGNIKWSVPRYYAQIATSDGGVIAQSYSGQSYTFDANGNSTGQLASLPTQSWTGNAYQVGSIDQKLFTPTNLATSFWAFAGANQSGNGTAAQQTEYPQLVSCYASDNPNPPPCPGPRQIIWNAYKALAIMSPLNSAPAILTTNASQIQQYVFNRLIGANGSIYRDWHVEAGPESGI